MTTLAHRVSACSALAAAALFLFGCASPAPPRPPSLHLPEPLQTVVAARRGPVVLLTFTVPTHSTDGFSLTAPVTASVCRSLGEGPCTVTGRRVVSGYVEWTDALPQELTSGPPRPLSYRVELLTPAGRSAGPSEPAFAAAGQAPAPVQSFRAEGSRAGIALRWQPEDSSQVLLERTRLSPGPPARSPRQGTLAAALPRKTPRKAPGTASQASLPASPPQAVWLHAAPDPTTDPATPTPTTPTPDRGGLLDVSAAPETTYRYIAQRSRTVTLQGHTLELRSSLSDPVDFTLRDIYPPAVPSGLAAAAFPLEGSSALRVDLIWQPNTEADLAGYLVYRQSFSAEGVALGEPTALNPAPVRLPAFADTTAQYAMRYKYTVAAVDAKGNRSAPSAPTDLTTQP